MSLFFVTGISGAGKSAVSQELKHRGYTAYDTDEDGIARWRNNKTGFIYPKSSVKAKDRTPEFIEGHSWVASRETVEGLAKLATNKTAFLCGVIANEKEVWDLFTAVFGLVINDETLVNRIKNRTSNDWGKQPHELEQILSWQKGTIGAYRKFGHIVIDAQQPLELVVNQIIKKAEKLS